MQEDAKNMKQYKVFPRQSLVVINLGVHDDNDLTGLVLPDDARGMARREEHGVGFGGTLLSLGPVKP